MYGVKVGELSVTKSLCIGTIGFSWTYSAVVFRKVDLRLKFISPDRKMLRNFLKLCMSFPKRVSIFPNLFQIRVASSDIITKFIK